MAAKNPKGTENTGAADESLETGDGRLDESEQSHSYMAPRHLTKQEFGRKLAQLCYERGWNQSDLARHANLRRAAISTYMRGRSIPEATTLKKLAGAFSLEPDDLLPNTLEAEIDADDPALEIKQSRHHPGKMWLRINRLVTPQQAMEVMNALLDEQGNEV